MTNNDERNMHNPYTSSMIEGSVESVTDEMLLLNPIETPLINLLGFGKEVTNTEHVWHEDSPFAFATKATADESELDATVIAVASVGDLRVEDVIKNGEEQILVESIDKATNTITVRRAYGETQSEPITAGKKLEVLFSEAAEGKDFRPSRFKPRQRQYNYTQIFDEGITVTGTAQAVSQHGVDNLYEYEKQKKQLELAGSLEKALINGIRYESPDGNVRMMGGLRYFAETVEKSDMTYEDFVDVAQELYEQGAHSIDGHSYVIMVGVHQKRKLSRLQNEKVVIDRDDKKRGEIVNEIVTDFGVFPVVLNKNVAPDEIFIIDLDKLSINPLKGRSWHHKFLGKTGDRIEGQIVGEYVLVARHPQTMRHIKGLNRF